YQTLFAAANPIMVKAALNLSGFKVGGLRSPLVEADEKQREQLRYCLRRLGLL
ncbi:MAG: 4-hydroxy-tetrahydrodipicolinate synthase, partial [Firmicutes bacterium]|nr:4-hydroxy-tetrahydrodipicolinate synthase [Bacillota bacterium]